MIRKCITIYTDGACCNNGRSGAKAGIGVFWDEEHPLNLSKRLTGDRQTNQRAEIVAARIGIEQARANGYNDITIKTDSNYLKNGAENWIHHWQLNGWRKPVVNKKEFQDLKNSMDGIKVRFEKVASASNAADRLARDGARRES